MWNSGTLFQRLPKTRPNKTIKGSTLGGLDQAPVNRVKRKSKNSRINDVLFQIY